MIRFKCAIVLMIAVAGCTNANIALNSNSVSLEKRGLNHTLAATGGHIEHPPTKGDIAIKPASHPTTLISPAPDCFVGIAISGGGSRSANFAAACMLQLGRIGLLQKVNYISSVSGGSLAAAYYCVSDNWNPKDVEKDMAQSFADDLLFQTLLPWNLIGMGVSDLDRSDLLAGVFERNLFNRNGRGLTFADLRPDRPHLLINATDMQSGKRFIFCNESFDQLNSDLSRYPISYAVAASSAVPVLLHQVTLRDFSTDFKQYRHLIDGGVADNLGIQTLVETYEAQTLAASNRREALPYRNGAVLILIDAKTDYDSQLSSQGDTGFLQGLKASAGLTSTALLARAESATLSEVILKYAPDNATAQTLRAQMKQLEDEGYVELRDLHQRPVKVIHLALTRVKDLSNVPYATFKERVNSIETYFNIDPAEAYNLYVAADLLVKEKFEPRLRAINEGLSASH